MSNPDRSCALEGIEYTLNMTSKYLITVALGALIACAASFSAVAQTPIVLGATSSNLKILFDALEPAYREAGFAPEWRELPGARLLADLKSAKLDVLIAGSGSMAKQFGDTYTPVGIGGDALGYSRVFMYYRAEDAGKYSADPNTWAGLTVGEIVNVGPSCTFGFPKNVEGVTIVTAPTYETLIRMLYSCRFDFIVSTQGGIEQDLLDTGYSSKIIRGSEPLLNVDYWHMVNGRFAERLPALIRAINKRKPQIDEAIEQLLNR